MCTIEERLTPLLDVLQDAGAQEVGTSVLEHRQTQLEETATLRSRVSTLEQMVVDLKAENEALCAKVEALTPLEALPVSSEAVPVAAPSDAEEFLDASDEVGGTSSEAVANLVSAVRRGLGGIPTPETGGAVEPCDPPGDHRESTVAPAQGLEEAPTTGVAVLTGEVAPEVVGVQPKVGGGGRRSRRRRQRKRRRGGAGGGFGPGAHPSSNNSEAPTMEPAGGGQARPSPYGFAPYDTGSESETILIGDSIVREQRLEFTQRAPDVRRVICGPGKGVEWLGEQVSRLQLRGRDSCVVTHIGTNDLKRTRPEELVSRLETNIRSLKQKTDRVLVTSLLPRPRDGANLAPKVCMVNRLLQSACNRSGAEFLDVHPHFDATPGAFRDGLHLSEWGVARFGRLLHREVARICNPPGRANQGPQPMASRSLNDHGGQHLRNG